MNFLSKVTLLVTLFTVPVAGFAMDSADFPSVAGWLDSAPVAAQDVVTVVAPAAQEALPVLETEIAPGVWATVKNTAGQTVATVCNKTADVVNAGKSYVTNGAATASQFVATTTKQGFDKAYGNEAIALAKQGFNKAYGNEAVALIKAHPAISTSVAVALGTVAVVKFAPRLFPTKAAQKAKIKAAKEAKVQAELGYQENATDVPTLEVVQAIQANSYELDATNVPNNPDVQPALSFLGRVKGGLVNLGSSVYSRLPFTGKAVEANVNPQDEQKDAKAVDTKAADTKVEDTKVEDTKVEQPAAKPATVVTAPKETVTETVVKTLAPKATVKQPRSGLNRKK